VLIVAVAAGVLAYLLVSDDSTSGSGGNANANAGASAAAPATQATFTATAFDPLGDGKESNELLGNVNDSDPATAWSTEQYDNPFPDGDKTGVGLALDLNGEYDVRDVTVDALESGWGASIYVSGKPVSDLVSLSDWGPVLAKGSDLGEVHTFPTGKVKGQSVLIWFTELPVQDNNKGEPKHYLEVSEVKVA
jgi:hypothetical protein